MELEYSNKVKKYRFNSKIYQARVYNAVGAGDDNKQLVYGPNIADWPKMQALKDNLLLKVVSVINDPVTTTDELIPSGETSLTPQASPAIQSATRARDISCK